MSLPARIDHWLLRRHTQSCPWPTGAGADTTKKPSKPSERKAQKMIPTYPTIEERLWPRIVEQPNGCRVWPGAVNRDGYGNISFHGTQARAHRVAWEITFGPIPDGMLVCHTCDNPPCCNLTHLFLGTIEDNNVDRAMKGRTFNANKTHCKHGHPFDAENTRVSPEGYRRCRACGRTRGHSLDGDVPSLQRLTGTPSARSALLSGWDES